MSAGVRCGVVLMVVLLAGASACDDPAGDLGDPSSGKASPSAGPETSLGGERRAEGAAREELENTTWLLESYGDAQAPRTPLAEVTVSAEFVPETAGSGRVQGNAGCNGYSASFEREGQALKIGDPIATRKFCNPPALMEQEAAFLAALAETSEYKVDADRLSIIYGSGQVLSFRREAAVE